MKIVSIFEGKLFAFHYEKEDDNELERLLSQWNDTSYLCQFVRKHRNDAPAHRSVQELVTEISENAYDLDDTLNELLENSGRSLDEFFKPLNNQELGSVLLSKQKGRKNYLRLYAIRIDANCYVITGGAIKFTQRMQDRPHTEAELSKLNRCRDYLRANGVSDSDSFYEFLSEEE